MYSILNHPLISQNYFYPSYKYISNPYIVQSGNNKLACYYKEVPNATKTIIHFHGNGELASDYIYSELSYLGCNILYAEYRGYGSSSGDGPSLVNMLDDVEYIIKSINKPLEDIILFGRSVGSIYAIHGASMFPEIGGLIIESGIAYVVQRITRMIDPSDIGSTLEEFLNEGEKYFDHKKKLEKFQGKILIMHTKNDSLVNSENSISLHNWANEPKGLKLFLRGDHNDIMIVNKKEYIHLVKVFIETLDK